MQLRSLSERTIETYVTLIERYARYFKKSPHQLGAEEVRLLIRAGKRSGAVCGATRAGDGFLLPGRRRSRETWREVCKSPETRRYRSRGTWPSAGFRGPDGGISQRIRVLICWRA
jgi:hypothetical protein